VVAANDNAGMGAHDSGLAEILLSLGWLGGLAYLLAIGSVIAGVLKSGASHELFYLVGACISVSILAELPLGSMMRDIPGVVAWSFAGACMALRARSEVPSQAMSNVGPVVA
jgi:hypothetical protein